MDNFILCGMQFGDEGKGTFVDYLSHEKNIECVIKYNGGSQASHTVVTPEGIVHKFSQLSSGMFLPGCNTYLSENMVINLDNLLVEIKVFSNKTGIPIPDLLDRIHIHQDCFVVTPYHKLINKLREFSLGSNRRGTVGTGVSEVRYLLNEPKIFPYEQALGLQVKDIFPYNYHVIENRLDRLQTYVSTFYLRNEKTIWKNVPENMKEDVNQSITFLLRNPKSVGIIAEGYNKFNGMCRGGINLINCIYSAYELTFRKDYTSAIFEGSQGLLIDGTYGIKPNTTFLDTTNHFALDISYYRDNITKIGIAKAFMSRHGLGVFPTETDEVSSKICDDNQEESYWNGKIRFGWFDAVLFRYAQSINQVDEIYLSSLDKLDSFDTIKICTEYLYTGTVDEKFNEIFHYTTSQKGEVHITDIKKNSENLNKYLVDCIPLYTYVKGWNTDISGISDKSQLPDNCLEYIHSLEKVTGIPITLVSVGLTRENKIRMW